MAVMTDARTIWCRCGTVALVVAVLVLSKTLVVSTFFNERSISATLPAVDEDHDEVDDGGGRRSLLDMLQALPIPRIDEMDFRSDVVRPMQQMVEKFPKHPNMVIQKLQKVVSDEENRWGKSKVENFNHFYNWVDDPAGR